MNLNLSRITDNKNFWKTMHPFLSNKGVSGKKIALVERDQIILENKGVAETFNIFSGNAVASLKLYISDCYKVNFDILENPIEAIINTDSQHYSKLKINTIVNFASCTST